MHNDPMDDAAAWLDQLPPDLGAQRRLLQRLLDWSEHDDDVRWLTSRLLLGTRRRRLDV